MQNDIVIVEQELVIEVVVRDRKPDCVAEMEKDGAVGSESLADLCAKLEPPPVRLPVNPGHPIASESQPTTVRSITAAAGAERHAVTFWLRTDAARSAAAATGSPGPTT